MTRYIQVLITTDRQDDAQRIARALVERRLAGCVHVLGPIQSTYHWEGKIESAQDAIWYVLVTMSTVGYGDFYPVTDPGRIIGSLIILVGVGVFGTLTGFLANAFLSPSGTAAGGPPPEADAAGEIEHGPGG